MNRFLPLMFCLPLVACDDDGAAHDPWTPERELVDDSAAALEPAIPGDCGDVHIERWRYRYAEGRVVEAARFSEDATEPDRVEVLHYDEMGRFSGVEMSEGERHAAVTLQLDGEGTLTGRVVDSSEPSMRSRMELVERTDEQVVIDYDGAVLFLPFSPAEGPSIPKALCAALQDTGIRGAVMIDELVRRVETEKSIDDFTPFRVREARTFDEAGRLVRTTWDLRRDGRFDMVETIRHEALPDGRREHVALARWADPNTTYTQRTYDERDRLIGEVTADEVRTYRWLNDDLVAEERREGADGTWIRTVTLEDGVQRTEVDEDGDVSPEQITHLFLNEAGERVLKQEDMGGDGVVDWQKRYVYRQDGKRAWEERDRSVDGVPDQRSDYTYDAEGRVSWEVITEAGSQHCAGIR